MVEISGMKAELSASGYELMGDEPLKITVAAKDYGYTGYELAEKLMEMNIVSEFADPDYLVLMLTPEVGASDLERLKNGLFSIPPKAAINKKAPAFSMPERIISVREAAFSVSETIPAAESPGRILASATVGCPPAVPIVVSGERIDPNAVKVFEYYGIETVNVIKEEVL